MSVVTTQRAVEAVVDGLLARERELVDAMLERNAEEAVDFADLGDDAEMLEAVRDSARTNLREALAALSRDRRPPEQLPTGAVEEARSAARAGISVTSLLHTYRIGHAVVWEAIIDEVERLDLDPAARRDLLRAITRYTFSYIDGIIPLVSEAYAEERERLLNRREQRRVQAVRDLLDGGTAGADELDYPLGLSHVALVVAGAARREYVDGVARLHQSRVLAVDVTRETTWAWLGKREWADAELAAVAEHEADGVRVALGEPGSGPEGFRLSHGQALRARQVGQLLRRGVTRFRSVAFEAVMLQDERAARAFVESELAPLGDDKSAEKLKETLRAYFAVGLNASAAGALLGVHERTVGYRLRVVEEALSATLNDRRLEIEAALRLERALSVSEAASS